MLIVRLDENFTDTALAVLKRDKLIEGDNGGVLFLADLSKLYSFALAGGSTPPTAGDAIRSLTEANNGAFRQAVTAPIYGGNGLDFTPLAAGTKGTHVEIPAAVLANIWGSTNHYFMVCAYVKLPAQADWNAGAGVLPFLSGETQYTSGADLVCFGQISSGQDLSFRRQYAAATADQLIVSPAVADYGAVVQLAFWRNAAGQGARLRSANGTVLTTMAVGTNNTQNFSAKTLQAGVGAAFWPAPPGNPAKFKLYRAFVENLETSGRDPTTVLDADYARVVAAGLFS